MKHVDKNNTFAATLITLFAAAAFACGPADEPAHDMATTPDRASVGQKTRSLAGGWPTTDAQEVVLLSVNTPYVTHCTGTQISAHWILTSALCIPQTADTITVRVRYRNPGSSAFQQVYPPGASQGVQYGNAHVYRQGYFWRAESAFALLRLDGAGMGANFYPAALATWGAWQNAWYYIVGYGATIEPPTKMMGTMWAHDYGAPWWGGNGPTDTHVFDNGAPWMTWTSTGRRVIVAMTSAAYSHSSQTFASPVNQLLWGWIENISRGTPHPLDCDRYRAQPLDYTVCYE